VKHAGREIVVLAYACRNPATPLSIKLVTAALALYVVYPIDLLPDLFPVLGWIDDATLLTFVVPALLRWVPVGPNEQARTAAGRLLSRWRFWRTG
jgi:uncharacterized membrane protein YkvA (DUF1232 family)